MGKIIVTENLDPVLSSHRGLPPSEIVQDCLEKAKSMLAMATNAVDLCDLPSDVQHQYWCLLDDLVELAIKQYSLSQRQPH